MFDSELVHHETVTIDTPEVAVRAASLQSLRAAPNRGTGCYCMQVIIVSVSEVKFDGKGKGFKQHITVVVNMHLKD